MLLQQSYIPGKGRRVAGNIDDAPGIHPVHGLDGIGTQPLPGWVNHHHIRADTLLFQLQGGGSGIGAEKFRVFNAVAPGVVPGILHRLLDYLHPDDPSGGGCHGKGDGAHAAVQIQHQILLRNSGKVDGGLIQPLCLMVVYLIEAPGGQPEGQAAEGVLDIALAVEGEKSVPQHGVALFGVDAEHQSGKAGDLLEPLNQLLRTGDFLPVDDKAHQNLSGNRPPADIDVPQKPLVRHFVIGSHPILVDIIHNRSLHGIGLLRQNIAAVIFHHLMGACPKESGIRPTLFLRHGVLRLVPVAKAGGSRQNGHFFQLLPGHPVQAGFHPLRLQPGLLLVIHVPEIAAAAELGHGALPVHPVGGFFQNLRDFPGSPGLLRLFNPHPNPFPGNGVGDEHGAALNVGDALSLGGVVGDDSFVNFVFGQHICSLQNRLHGDISGLHPLLFVKGHGAVVAAPDIQSDGTEALSPGILADMVIQLLADVLAPAGFVHAQVVDIQGFFVLQNRVILGLLVDAEAVAQHSFLHSHEDGALRILQQLLQSGMIVFQGMLPEQVGADVPVDMTHLTQQVQNSGNIGGVCKTNFHSDFFLSKSWARFVGDVGKLEFVGMPKASPV